MHGADVPVTVFLRRWCAGDEDALGPVREALDAALRQLARRQLYRGRNRSGMATLDLVNEVFLEFLERVKSGNLSFENRQHFLAVFALAVQSTYIDLLRRQAARKRGGDSPVEQIGYGELLDDHSGRYWALNVGLDRLREHNLRSYLVFIYSELLGYTMEEIAGFLGATRQAATKWKKLARLFLANEIDRSQPPGPFSLIPVIDGEA